MAYEVTPYAVKFTAIAGADLSSSQFLIVKMSAANTVVACSAITDIPIGVLQNAPKQGEEAEVLVSGISKVKASAAITVPNLVGTTTGAKAAAIVAGTATTVYTVGQAITAAGADGDLFTVAVDCTAPGRAA